ncbi:MAG: phosphoribulokinase [Actinomycetota bacterium]|nr:phosphoribulokinase [Actinomycetota bacterium]
MPHKQVVMQRASSTSARESTHVPMLAIAGDSAAGKTTITKGLVDALGANRITSMCSDDYHRYDRMERKTLPFTPLHPDCNYLGVMEQHLQLLALGQPILKPVYSHSTGTLERPVLVDPAEFVIVEGLFPLWSKLSRACFDVTVYLDPPEPIRHEWKIKRDTTKRGYTAEQVLAELERREPEATAYIRPQRRHADIVLRFSRLEGHSEGPLSATLLLRPTIAHPDLSDVLGSDTREAIHLKLIRDDDGKPVDAIHIHGHAPRELTRKVEEAIWSHLDMDEPVPESLGVIEPGTRSEPLAVSQLILLYHMLAASKH